MILAPESSSGINSMAANTVQDILRRPLGHLKEATITFITKLLVLAYGALAIGLAFFMATYMHGPATQMVGAVFGAIGSPIMGIIVMGASIPWANKYGAFAGALASLGVNLWVSLGSILQATPLKALSPITTENCFAKNSSAFSSQTDLVISSNLNTHQTNLSSYENLQTTVTYKSNEAPNAGDTFFLYDITYEWYPIIGCTVCILVGLIVSFLTSPRSERDSGYSVHLGLTDAKYIFPFLRPFWGFEDELNAEDDDKDNNFEIEDEKPEKHGDADTKREPLEMETLLKESKPV